MERGVRRVIGRARRYCSYKNVDGQRVEDGRYAAFQQDLATFIPRHRVVTDPLRRFAYGTDASFYRLTPKVVVKIQSEDEVVRILPIAGKRGTPVTFRAAGTSLSGQAVTDSVLLKLSHVGTQFRKLEIKDGGRTFTAEPGVIGGEVNRALAAYSTRHGLPRYKLGPDPSSIDSCMLGGIVANNSSGMCCGVAQNTYHTLQDMRVVFADGTVLDTADPTSCAAFLSSPFGRAVAAGVSELARRVQADRELTALIRRKFSIKCTTGYGINALVDFAPDNVVEIVKRIIIGSEGTLGFVSQMTYATVPDLPCKASSMMIFDSIEAACVATAALRKAGACDAVELFDRVSLRAAEGRPDCARLVPMRDLSPSTAALLVETRGSTDAELDERIAAVCAAVKRSGAAMTAPPKFTKDPKEYNVLWDVRKGLIPMVGGARETGTSMLIEDVACPIEKLAAMTLDLEEMFRRHGYNDACLFGHALEGNLHLVFSQGFRTASERDRYAAMMQELSEIVAIKHGGSLKAEHGTGRNVAPFVEMEWGAPAVAVMWELKKLFDPQCILNPGVILNQDPMIHTKSIKASPPADPLVDRCIECGFCESNCPSRDSALTPRQRITVLREMRRMEASGESTALKEFQQTFPRQFDDMCAADGMCAEKCPVKINTGALVVSLRAERKRASAGKALAMLLAKNFGMFGAVLPGLLAVADVLRRVVGAGAVTGLTSQLNRLGNMVPVWNPYFPATSGSDMQRSAGYAIPARPAPDRRVVYFAACPSRLMGPARGDPQQRSVADAMLTVLAKAGYEVIIPGSLGAMCCGMMFHTKGYHDAAELKVQEALAQLRTLSDGGRVPIVVDTSPCLATLKARAGTLAFSLYDPVDFIESHVVDRLDFTRAKQTVMLHVPCSSKKLALEPAFSRLAARCAETVHLTGVPCCGMAGDRGMRYPELPAGALQHLTVPQSCADGYSTSRTCELALSYHSGVHFRSIVHLVDAASTARKAPQR